MKQQRSFAANWNLISFMESRVSSYSTFTIKVCIMYIVQLCRRLQNSVTYRMVTFWEIKCMICFQHIFITDIWIAWCSIWTIPVILWNRGWAFGWEPARPLPTLPFFKDTTSVDKFLEEYKFWIQLFYWLHKSYFICISSFFTLTAYKWHTHVQIQNRGVHLQIWAHFGFISHELHV